MAVIVILRRLDREKVNSSKNRATLMTADKNAQQMLVQESFGNVADLNFPAIRIFERI